jgi:hypothetical protein
MISGLVKALDSRHLGSALASARRAFRMNRAVAGLGLNGAIAWQIPLEAPNSVAELCDQHGSDKGSRLVGGRAYQWMPHRYCEFYARMFDHCRLSVRRVFECGLGTGNDQFSANMGPGARPGASLRVWRDYFPHAQIHGADIDRSILFSEDRINTYFVDQTSPALIEAMWRDVGEDAFDLIIDDGLHTVDAAETLFLGSFGKLRQGGVYVVEDMFEGYAVSLCNRLGRHGVFPEIVGTTALSGGTDSFLVVIRHR